MKKKVIIIVSIIIALVLIGTITNLALFISVKNYDLNKLTKTKCVFPSKRVVVYPDSKYTVEEEYCYRYGMLPRVYSTMVKVNDIVFEELEVSAAKYLKVDYDEYDVIVEHHFGNWNYFYRFKGRKVSDINACLDARGVESAAIKMLIEGEEVVISYSYASDEHPHADFQKEYSYSIKTENGERLYFSKEKISDKHKEYLETVFFAN